MSSSNNRTIFHIDMDAFFASIEQRDNPQYMGKPVIVGARPGNRGVVSTSSYEARRFGIHSAMPINEAYRRCPDGIFVTPRMHVYESVSKAIMNIFEQFSPRVEQVSVDEAFLDMSGTDRLFGSPLDAAKAISERIRSEQKLTGSIGVAPNKFLAKIASDFNKPNGITIVPSEPQQIIEWLAPMKVGKIWGVGVKSTEVLQRMGICTVGDLQNLSLEYLNDRFGKQGISLYNLCRGIDERPVGEYDSIKSISREHTFNADSRDRNEWRDVLFLLVQDVSRRARRYGVKGHTVFLTWRRPDFSRHSRRKSLPQSSNTAKLIFDNALQLLEELKEPSLRLLGVGVTGLDDAEQTDLFAQKTIESIEATEAAVDRIVARFGNKVIGKGREVGKDRDHIDTSEH
ncbi:MAG: DNA polymerase IV [Fibrobacter sp.]|nr:DNA polymerase IV [Fibrobacter sp.]